MTEYHAPDRIDPASLDDYLSVMSKAIFQSGMSWRVVAAKWPGILDAFHGFDVHEIAGWSEPEIDQLGGASPYLHAALVGRIGTAVRRKQQQQNQRD